MENVELKMIFDKNTMGFPTMLHRNIYMTALQITPPELSLSEIEKSESELAESGREYYSFMIELLADMYTAPESYGFHPGAYEEFTDGRKYNAVKRHQPNQALIFYDMSTAELS